MDVDLELELTISRRESPECFCFMNFVWVTKATEATSNVCGTMGKNVLFTRTAQHCFNRFKNCNLEIDDLPLSGGALQVDLDVLKQLIEEDPRLTTWCLAERLGCVLAIVETHLKELGKIWCLDTT